MRLIIFGIFGGTVSLIVFFFTRNIICDFIVLIATVSLTITKHLNLGTQKYLQSNLVQNIMGDYFKCRHVILF